MLTSDILDIGTSRWIDDNLRGYDLMFARNGGFGSGGAAGATAALPSSFALPPVPNVRPFDRPLLMPYVYVYVHIYSVLPSWVVYVT
jgi:hypothetical protein